ncbi:MAG: hypothetical protein ACFBSF_21340 [Leptolyngbyaceae cyanobacterium]
MSTSTMIPITNQIRQELGDFSSVVCFKAAVVGIEEALGEKAATIALVTAGRQRGKDLSKSLGLSGKQADWEEVTQLLQKALGKEGTRLCLINKITKDEQGFKVYCQETICSSMESQGSARSLSYTLGAIQGAIEEITGRRLRGHQIESVLRGSNYDVISFEIIA